VKKTANAIPELVFLDTNFLIDLIDTNQHNHTSAREFFEWFRECETEMLTSTICIAEFSVTTNPSGLLPYLEVEQFDIESAKQAGHYAKIYHQHKNNNEHKACFIDDLKIISQAKREMVNFLVTSDRKMQNMVHLLNSKGETMGFEIIDHAKTTVNLRLGKIPGI